MSIHIHRVIFICIHRNRPIFASTQSMKSWLVCLQLHTRGHRLPNWLSYVKLYFWVQTFSDKLAGDVERKKNEEI